jgi:hypothetical protein
LKAGWRLGFLACGRRSCERRPSTTLRMVEASSTEVQSASTRSICSRSPGSPS